MFTYERLAQILLANGVNSPAELEKVLRYVLVLRDRPLLLDCPAGGGGSNQQGAGDPGGALVPDFVGQRYKDTNTGNIWVANSITPGDWTLEVQNTGVRWTPTNVKLGEKVGFSVGKNDIGPALPGIEHIVLNVEHILWVDIEGQITDLLSLSSNTLLSIDDADLTNNIGLTVINCDKLASISFPLLSSMTWGYVKVILNPLLTSVSLPSLIVAGQAGGWYGLNISQNTSLTTIDISSYFPTDGEIGTFTLNNLSAASVNHILSRYVANPGYANGSITLNGGTNAAPTGQGIVDKATLLGRGVTVTTN